MSTSKISPIMKPTVIIEKEDFKQKFEFELDSNGNPIKLGDGSFGIVFKVTSNSEDYAIKLFYEELGEQKLTELIFSQQVLKQFCQKNTINKSSAKYKALKPLANEKSYSIGSLLHSLKSIDLSIAEMESMFSIILSSSKTNSGVKERYSFERDASKNIREGLRRKGESATDDYAGIIKIVAGTDAFKQSDAYSVLRDKFEEEEINISDFATIMPMYKYTLKELLERNTGNYTINQNNEQFKNLVSGKNITNASLELITNKVFESEIEVIELIASNDELSPHQKDLKEAIYELNGYDLLQSMTYAGRISTILPYLLHVCRGLRALHSANKCHYDIKPSNIFVKGADPVTAVLGDLGYFIIPTVQLQTNHASVSKGLLPLGTRHYRSPEQKDYFDICDVEITKEGNLIIRDPKFIDTIIEAEDYVVFSKDINCHKHFIQKKKFDTKAPMPIEIILKKEAGKTLKPDKRTQAIFYKQQKLKTDLFGFGALVFDMLTGGKSPERFYDKIRNFDVESNNIGDIISDYEQVKGYQVTDPKLLNIFSDFKDTENDDYAPKSIVELILKCMLYKAKNTYFKQQHTNTDSAANTPVQLILKDLLSLRNKYPVEDFNNHLLNKTYPKNRNTNKATLLKDKLEEIQKNDFEQLHTRLMEGVWHLKRLVELVRRTLLNTDNDRTVHFCQLLPTNIIVRERKLDFIFIAYQDLERYKEDLKNDSVHAKVTRDIANPFVPNYLSFLRRQIQLTPVGNNKFKYIFLESALLGSTIEKGDWIIVNDNLCYVSSIEGQIIELTNDSDDQLVIEKEEGEENSTSKHLYYKNLDPCFYYLQMLGIYIYHLFFIGLGSVDKDKPLLITIVQSLRFLKEIDDPLAFTLNEMEVNSVKEIYEFLTIIYLKLVFPFHKQSYYQFDTDDKNKIISLNRDQKLLI